MDFVKYELTPTMQAEVDTLHLYNIVDGEPARPKYCVADCETNTYLFSLSNQAISFEIKMPRYFALFYQQKVIVFYAVEVINKGDEYGEEAKGAPILLLGGLRLPAESSFDLATIYQVIHAATTVYYQGVDIKRIIHDGNQKVSYYQEDRYVTKVAGKIQLIRPNDLP